MAKKIPLEPFAYRNKKRKRQVKDPIVLMKGIQKLRSKKHEMMKREIREAQDLSKNILFRGHISQKLQRIKSLEKKGQRLLRTREMQLDRLAIHGPEFPTMPNRPFFFENLIATDINFETFMELKLA